MISRRKLLSTAAIATPALALAACSPAEVEMFQQDWSAFAGKVQALVATATGIIPTVESVAATIAALFGPQWAATVALGSQVLNEVVAAITAAISTFPATSSKLARATLALPVQVGKLPDGTPINGYRAR